MVKRSSKNTDSRIPLSVNSVKATARNYKWVQDPSGYFTIKVFPKEKCVKIRFHNNKHKVLHIISGKRANDILGKVFKMNLISRMDHAAYLGKELQKAFIALKHKLTYIQDEELNINKSLSSKNTISLEEARKRHNKIYD